ncbi:unnamed protein product [Schistosoma rodhaini]|uniref:Uncharacterized protein n=1 Tax=Schistosoma rodhaini TaxID=6188 RepID=A0AA85F1Y7_9TREM|nr:unnamed protein product [Schistosoma rodhaini]
MYESVDRQCRSMLSAAQLNTVDAQGHDSKLLSPHATLYAPLIHETSVSCFFRTSFHHKRKVYILLL